MAYNFDLAFVGIVRRGSLHWTHAFVVFRELWQKVGNELRQFPNVDQSISALSPPLFLFSLALLAFLCSGIMVTFHT